METNLFGRRGFIGTIAAAALGFVSEAGGQEQPQQGGGNGNANGGNTAGQQGVPQHNHVGPGQGGSTLIAEELIHKARVTDTSPHASAHRPIISTAPKEVYVDPNTGNDSNDGSQGAPYRTIQAALERVPLVVQHDHHINLANGTYSAGKAVSAVMHFAGGSHDPHPMRIQGNPDDPSKVVIDNNVKLSTRSNEMDNALLRDVTITGSVQNIDSHFQVQNVRFTGTNSEAIISGAAFKTHDPSVTMLRDCTFSDAYDYAVDAAVGAEVMLDDCTGSVSDTAILVDKGATAIDLNSNDVTAPNGYINITAGSRYVPKNGPVRTGSNGSNGADGS
jgi:hypothetical protein